MQGHKNTNAWIFKRLFPEVELENLFRRKKLLHQIMEFSE
jgi:hypothetical protein